jgi:hypothetical protein
MQLREMAGIQRSKGSQGAFWEDRYYATAVELSGGKTNVQD